MKLVVIFFRFIWKQGTFI